MFNRRRLMIDLLLVGCLSCLLFSNCSKEITEVVDNSLGGRREEIAYDVFERTKIDIHYGQRLPKGELPVLIFIHGGGWCNGDKSEWTERHSAVFMNAGYVCVSLNYRLSSLTPGLMDDVYHPMHVQDVARAMMWIQRTIADYGGDPHRMVLVGHSAGAHLAALVAIDQKYLLAEGFDVDNILKVVLLDGGRYLSESDGFEDYLQPYYDKATDDGNEVLKKDFIPVTHLSEFPEFPEFILVYSTIPSRIEANMSFAEILSSRDICVQKISTNVTDHYEVLTSFPFFGSVNCIDLINLN